MCASVKSGHANAILPSPIHATHLTPDSRQAVVRWLGNPPHKSALWEWQYAPRRHQAPDTQNYVVLECDGAVSGFNGVMPVNVRIGTEVAAAAWSCDFVVAPPFRRQGIGSALKERLRQRHPLLMALGISDNAVPVHRKSGWTATGTRVMQFTLKRNGWTLRSLARRTLQGTWALRSLARHMLAGTARILSPNARRNAEGPTFVRALDAGMARKLGALWNATQAGWPNAVVRDEGYLTWRYAECPVARYDVVLHGAESAPQAALIFRRHDWETSLVDYLGPIGARDVKRALVDECLRQCADSATVSAITSDADLADALRSHGFLREQGGKARFHLSAPPALQGAASRTWFISSGDSDGEFLAAAHTYPQVQVREWTEEQFLAAEREWNELLARSNAHPLFMGFLWQRSSWLRFGAPSGARLRVLAAYNLQGELIGLAPLMLKAERIRTGVSIRRLSSIGTTWGRSSGMRTEYQSFIVRAGSDAGVVASFLSALRRARDWDELVLGDIEVDSGHDQLVRRFGAPLGYIRCPLPYRDFSHQVETTGNFADYLNRLSPSYRRRLYHARSKLQRRHGSIELEYAIADQVEAYMEELNRLHASRWGKPAFEGSKLEFNIEIARALAEQGNLRMSRLRCGATTLSVLLNLRCGREEINLQAGFDERFDRSIPLGYVHLGYALEDCFNSDIDTFDLLAGRGKNSDYKRHLATRQRELTVLQLIASPLIANAYALRDRWRPEASRPSAKRASA